LEAVVLDERGLEGVERRGVGSEILHGPNGRAVGLDGERRARLHRPAIELHGTGPTGGGVAADLRSSEIEVLPNQVDEEPARLDLQLDRLAVDGEADPNSRGAGRRRDVADQAGTRAAEATSSSALPMPSTIASI
jgi:hypothetical protein